MKHWDNAAIDAATGDDILASFEDIFADELKRKLADDNPAELTPINLTRWRWFGPTLRPDEERALLVRAKAGDGDAKNELARRFHRKVLKAIARYRKLIPEGLDEDDLVAAGELGFSQALANFDLLRNSRFSSYAGQLIAARVSDAVKDWRRRGQAGETRADRHVDSNPSMAAVDVAGKVGGCKPSVAADAIERSAAWRHHALYDTAADFHGTASRDVLRSRIADTIDGLAEEADRRAMRRLREIGRRTYALELVERDHARGADRFTHYGVPSLIQRGEPRLARYSPAWWLWQRTSLSAWHAAVRANAWPKEDRRARDDARASRALGKKPTPIRKPRIRVWIAETSLIAAE